MFKITIEETKSVKKVIGKEWKQVGTREVKRESCYTADASEPKTRIEPVFGYAPEVETIADSRSAILIQEVETLDLAKVIRAINNL